MSQCRCGSNFCVYQNQIESYGNQIRYYRAALQRGFYPGQADRPFTDRQKESIVNAIRGYENDISNCKAQVDRIVQEKRREKWRKFLVAKTVLEPNPAERKKKTPPIVPTVPPLQAGLQFRVGTPFDWNPFVPPMNVIRSAPPARQVPRSPTTPGIDLANAAVGCDCQFCEELRDTWRRTNPVQESSPQPSPDSCGDPGCRICNPHAETNP